MTKKRILYIDCPLPSPGGGQISLLNLLRGLDRERYDPAVCIPPGGAFGDRLAEQGVPCHPVALGALTGFIRKFKPDMVHCNAATTRYSFAAALTARLSGIPFVWHVRVLGPPTWRERWIAALASKIIVISDSVGQRFACLPSSRKVVKIYNPVDTRIFKPEYGLQQTDFNVEKEKCTLVVGMFSRLDPWKGHRLLLEVVPALLSQGQEILFLIAGTGEEGYVRQLQEDVRRKALNVHILFLGFREDTAALMNMCDCVINPSLDPEPFGRTIIEAMACGKPVIATAMGGPLEIIESGIDGLLIEPNADALSKALLFLAENTEERARMGQAALKKSAGFTLDEHVRRVQSVYEEMVPAMAVSG